MERNGHKQEKEPEPIAPEFATELALQGLVDVLFERSDKEAFRVFHLIANSIKSAE
jgi:hypothetical protein